MKKLVVVHGDGVHDDTEALQAIANGEADGIFPDGTPFSICAGKRFLITKPIFINCKIEEGRHDIGVKVEN